MPEAIAELSATITADTSKFERALAGARASLGRFQKSGTDAAKGVDATTAANDRATKSANALRGSFAGLTGVMGALSFGVALKGFKSLTDSASDLNESLGKSQVVFKDNAGAVEQWANKSAKSIGQSKQEALEAAGTFGNLFTSLNIGGKSAAQMSTKLVELAGDLASFNNTKPEEAILALRSAMTGEAEPMKRFGVNMNENTLKAQALKMGLIATAKEGLTPATKAAAAYQLILDQTKNAQGDFARTSGGLANQQRIVEAEFKNASAELGKNLLPVMLQATRVTSDLIGKFNELPNATKVMGLEFAALVAGAGPLTQVIKGAASLTTGLYGIGTAAGMTGMAALGTTAAVLAAGLVAAAFAGRDLLVVLDTINERNKVADAHKAMGAHSRALELYDNASQYEDETNALKKFRLLTKGERNVADIDATLGRALLHQNIKQFATDGELDNAIIRSVYDTEKLRTRGKETDRQYLDSLKDKKTGRIQPKPLPLAPNAADLGGLGFGIGFTPQASAGPTDGDKKRKHDEAVRHAIALASEYKRTWDDIFALNNTQWDVQRRKVNDDANDKRKAGMAEADVAKWVKAQRDHIAAEEKRDHDRRVKEARDKSLSDVAQAANDKLGRLSNLRSAGLIEAEEERSRILKALDLTRITDETRTSIYESGTEARVALLRRYDTISKEIADAELDRLQKLAKMYRDKAFYVPLGRLGGAYLTPKDLKHEPTDAEKESAALTERLRKGVADGRGAFSKADGHIDREAEAMARYDIDIEKVRKGTLKLTAEQKRLMAESMKWSVAKEQLDAYNKKIEQMKSTTHGIMRDAFAGAMEGSQGFFKSIRTSFKKLIVDMAAEWAASEVVKALFGLGGKKVGGLGADAKSARNDMIAGAAAVGAASAALSGAAASLAASGAALQAGGFASAGMAGAGAGLSTAAGAAGAAKSGGLLGAGLGRTLGYVGIGLAADQLLFKGAVSKTITGGLKKVGKIFGFANGGRPPLDRPSLVGENGPELIWPDKPSTVTSNKDSQSLLAGMGGGVQFNGPVSFHDRADVERVRATILAKKRQKARLA